MLLHEGQGYPIQGLCDSVEKTELTYIFSPLDNAGSNWSCVHVILFFSSAFQRMVPTLQAGFGKCIWIPRTRLSVRFWIENSGMWSPQGNPLCRIIHTLKSYNCMAGIKVAMLNKYKSQRKSTFWRYSVIVLPPPPNKTVCADLWQRDNKDNWGVLYCSQCQLLVCSNQYLGLPVILWGHFRYIMTLNTFLLHSNDNFWCIFDYNLIKIINSKTKKPRQ